MKYLIDTHTFIWFTSGDTLLSNTARVLIEDAQNDICLSIASIWEMAIKYNPFDRMIIAQAQQLNIPVIGKEETFKNYPIQLIW